MAAKGDGGAAAAMAVIDLSTLHLAATLADSICRGSVYAGRDVGPGRSTGGSSTRPSVVGQRGNLWRRKLLNAAKRHEYGAGSFFVPAGQEVTAIKRYEGRRFLKAGPIVLYVQGSIISFCIGGLLLNLQRMSGRSVSFHTSFGFSSRLSVK